MNDPMVEYGRNKIRQALANDPEKLSGLECQWQRLDQMQAELKASFEHAANELFRRFVEQTG